jgi:cell fate regulator YaaT (PSP1 superfamily)
MIVKFFGWDPPKNINSNLKDIKAGDLLAVDHDWGGIYLAKVLIVDQEIEKEDSVGEALRIASKEDLASICRNKKTEREILVEIKKRVRELNLEMKVFEVQLSVDEKCLVVVFVAEGRVDFRVVVRELSSKYQKTVRFQQIGSRDEARQMGGYGICGRELCCRKFPGSLKSITTEMARCQMVSHRGTERISGACGRLMCCLGFESDQYLDLIKDLPRKGEKIKAKGEEVEVIDINPISREIKIRKKDGTIAIIKKDEVE